MSFCFVMDLYDGRSTSTLKPQALAIRKTCKLVARETLGYWSEYFDIDALICCDLDLRRNSARCIAYVEWFGATMKNRWPYVKYIKLSLGRLVHRLSILELDEADAVKKKLEKSLSHLNWPIQLRNVSTLTIEDV